MVRTTYRVTVIKHRDGSTVTGLMEDDGLQSLWAVTQDDGTTAYVSELDEFTDRRRVDAYARDVVDGCSGGEDAHLAHLQMNGECPWCGAYTNALARRAHLPIWEASR